jgi:hypothetical protein
MNQIVDSREIDHTPASLEWTPEEKQAAAILDEMLEAMSKVIIPTSGDPDQWANESVAGCYFTRFGADTSIQVKIENSAGVLICEFNYRKTPEGKQTTYIDKMNVKEGIVPIVTPDIADLNEVKVKLLQALVKYTPYSPS